MFSKAHQRTLVTVVGIFVILAVLLAACGGKKAAPAPTATQAAAPAVTLQIASVGDTLTFDKDRLSAPAGAKVTVTLKNNATAKGLQHNWVLVKRGREDAVATAGLQAGPANDWVPKNDPNVLAYTKQVDERASGRVTFNAPPRGTYAFICSFPGHAGTARGVFEAT